PHQLAGREPVRLGAVRQPLPGAARPDREPVVEELPPHRRPHLRRRLGRELNPAARQPRGASGSISKPSRSAIAEIRRASSTSRSVSPPTSWVTVVTVTRG